MRNIPNAEQTQTFLGKNNPIEEHHNPVVDVAMTIWDWKYVIIGVFVVLLFSDAVLGVIRSIILEGIALILGIIIGRHGRLKH